jgi:uncharacterized protein
VSTPTEPIPSNAFDAFGNAPSPIQTTNPDDPPWNLPSAILVLLGSVLALYLLQAAISGGYVFYVYGSTGFTNESLQTIVREDKTFIFVSVLSLFPAHLLTLALAWAVVTNFGKRPFFASLGWSWSPNFGLGASLALSVALLIVGFAVVYFIGSNETEIDQIIKSSPQSRIALALMAALTAPLVEEIVYRGVLFSALQRTIGTHWTVVAVLALFTIVHIPQYMNSLTAIGVLALVSVVLTMVRAMTGRLLPCFVIHLVFNGVQSVLILLSPYLSQP